MPFIFFTKFFLKKAGLFLIVLLTTFSFVFGSFYSDIQLVSAQSVEDREAQLRAELKKIEEEQAALQKTLDEQKGKTATIQRDVNVLGGQIKNAELNIQKKRIAIEKLDKEIGLRNETVNELNKKIARSKEALASLIKKTNDFDNFSLPEILLNNDNMSDFFVDLDSYTVLEKQLDELFGTVREIKGETEKEAEELEDKQNKELDVKQEIEQEKRTIAAKKSEQDTLLNASKKTEASYEQVLAEKRAKAASIRAALFQLRDSAGIQFGDAVDYAEKAASITGVRAAFILAILKQESDLGKNVGTCNRAGDPEEKKWYNIMPGPDDNSWRDDQTIFKRITTALGLDIDSTPLSCPWAGGWGGAMGPSQFIPTTWSGYEARIAASLGVKTANPWNPEHAVMATALYMKDLGAAGGGYTAERTAALKYYAGSNWSLPQNAFYGNSVMVHVVDIQKQIDFLNDTD